MKRCVFLISIILYCSGAVCQVAHEYRQKKIDALLNEYKTLRTKQLYSAAAEKLQDAVLEAGWDNDYRDGLILRYAHLEYMKSHNMKFLEENFEQHELNFNIDRFSRLSKDQISYGLSLIYVKLKLYRLPYIKQLYVPDELLDMQTILENVPTLSVEPELAMYYSLIDMKINEDTRTRLLESVNMKLSSCKGAYLANAALIAYMNNKSTDYVNRCLMLAEKTDKAAADAVRAIIIENSTNASDDKTASDLYMASANQRNVLGSIGWAGCLIGNNAKEEAMKVLCSVEEDTLFAYYGGSIVKANLLSESRDLSDLQEAIQLYQAGIDGCLFKHLIKQAKKKYNECETQIALIQLNQQEEMIDYDDVVPAEFIALAKGYESYNEHEKAMKFYRLAAEMGDLQSMSKVALYDIQQGVLEGDESKTIRAARTIMENAESWFTPFLYNAVVVTLFGLDGNEPNAKKATKFLEKYLKKIKKDPLKSTYTEDDLLTESNYIFEETLSGVELLDLFESYEEAIEEYNKGVAYETMGEYEDAWYCYRSALFRGHPLASTKMDVVDKHIRW